MAESTDFQALENISTEVDESQVKIILSSQCIKAQSFLYNKLKKQAERQKELCNFVSNSNLKVEAEIKIAEQEVKSLNIAVETIKSANIELKKEYLLSKERKFTVFEHTKIGKKKYEDLWLTSKSRYESIPLIKQWLQVQNLNQTTRDSIDDLTKEYQQLSMQIKVKNKELRTLDTKRIIELAEYFVHERPKMFQKIREKSVKITEISKELEIALKDKEHNKSVKNSNTHLELAKQDEHNVQIPIDMKNSLVDNWPILSKDTDKDTLMMPKLHLQNNDLDILSVKLDQIKKTDLLNTPSMKRAGSSACVEYENNTYKKSKTEDQNNDCYVSSYFNISINISTGNEAKKGEFKNYSEKKLINILEDIKIDDKDTFNIIKKLQPTKFQETKYIMCPEVTKQSEKINKSEDKVNAPLESEDIEEIATPTPDVVAPPYQFLDKSHNLQDKQPVSFNMPAAEKLPTSKDEVSHTFKEIECDESEENNLNMSAASAESYVNMKEIILKKHNLDLSPQFVYSKNTLMHMRNDDVVIKSIFFENKEKADSLNYSYNDNKDNRIEDMEPFDRQGMKTNINTSEDMDTNVDIIVASSPKDNQNVDIKNENMPVAGLLFNHGPQGIPDSLNVSISTTGYEDSEDFPQCIDSSILLSPKGNFPTPAGGTHNEILSQHVPNFLSGFRKTGLPFFGGPATSDSQPDSGEQNKSSGFNFIFGNDDKKSRGGLFSMFR